MTIGNTVKTTNSKLFEGRKRGNRSLPSTVRGRGSRDLRRPPKKTNSGSKRSPKTRKKAIGTRPANLAKEGEKREYSRLAAAKSRAKTAKNCLQSEWRLHNGQRRCNPSKCSHFQRLEWLKQEVSKVGAKPRSPRFTDTNKDCWVVECSLRPTLRRKVLRTHKKRGSNAVFCEFQRERNQREDDKRLATTFIVRASQCLLAAK